MDLLRAVTDCWLGYMVMYWELGFVLSFLDFVPKLALLEYIESRFSLLAL